MSNKHPQPKRVRFLTTYSPWRAGQVVQVGPQGVPVAQVQQLLRAGKCEALAELPQAVEAVPHVHDPLASAEQREPPPSQAFTWWRQRGAGGDA